MSPVCSFAVSVLKRKLGYDDALDAFGIHAVSGVTGNVLAGLFCDAGLSWTDFGGLVYTGDPTLLGAQVLGIPRDRGVRGRARRGAGLRREGRASKGSLRVSEAEEA